MRLRYWNHSYQFWDSVLEIDGKIISILFHVLMLVFFRFLTITWYARHICFMREMFLVLWLAVLVANRYFIRFSEITLQWRHNVHDGVSNNQPHDCLLDRLFRRKSKKTSKFRVTGFVWGIHRSPVISPNKGPLTRKMFPFDDVIIRREVRAGWHDVGFLFWLTSYCVKFL